MNSKAKYIIFDMDGVIFDTEMLSKKIFLKIGEEYGMTDLPNFYNEIIGSNRERCIGILRKHTGDRFPLEEMHGEYVRRLTEYIDRNGPPVKPYVKELLTFLKENGYKIALASGSLYKVIINELKRAELLECFDSVTSGDMVTKGKPDPEIFNKAAASIGANPKETIVIEDSYAGITAAHRADMIPIMVPDQLPPTDEIRLIATAILPSLKAVEEFISTKE